MTATRTVAPPGSATRTRCAARLWARSTRSTSVAVSGSRTSRLLPYSGRPAQPRTAPYWPSPAAPISAVLLQHVDDLLEPEQVRLERRHVGEQERQALEPAVGQVPDVEGRDVQSVHRAPSRRGQADGATVEASIGQGERERAPGPLDRLDPDPAAVLLDDVARDRQPEARSAGRTADPRSVDLVEALEDPRLGRARDADAVVLDGDDDLRAGGTDRDQHLTAVGAELHRVVEEVDEDLPDPLLVALHRREPTAARRPSA